MSTQTTVLFLSGVLCAGYLVAALFFVRFWRDTRDLLFGCFAAAFLLLGLQRVLLVITEATAPVYVVRLVAFVLILWAIVAKNRER